MLGRWSATNIKIALIALFSGGALVGCGGETPPQDDASTSPLPERCDEATALFPVAPLLERPDHPCHGLLSRTYGRAVKGGASGSASVWTRATPFGTAIVASAAHVLKGFDADDADSPPTLFNPENEPGFLFVRLPESGAGGADSQASASFLLFHPAIPADQKRDGYSHILPRRDFFLLAADGQLLSTDPAPGVPEPIQPTSPPLHDPDGLTETPPTWADAESGDLELMIGYPASPPEGGDMAAAVGRVLSEEEIETALAALADAGDEEGSVAYDPEAEFILEGSAAVGMSGGGVYDRDGRQTGILVRASTTEGAPSIVRAVRMRWVISALKTTYNALSQEARDAVKPYLEETIDDAR
ncbi:MAG: hypothetical protein C4523_15580 [Myxococcales bacterium]|nr:MAG: hypothetical protein C4523_15580 [Myxococcales bacterium]